MKNHEQLLHAIRDAYLETRSRMAGLDVGVIDVETTLKAEYKGPLRHFLSDSEKLLVAAESKSASKKKDEVDFQATL